MKTKALDQIDTNLEQIITKLTAAGRRNAKNDEAYGQGVLPEEEHDSLRIAQETLGLLRSSRKTAKSL